MYRGFLGGTSGKELTCECRKGNVGSVPGWGGSRGGHGVPLQYSCLGNPVDRGAWRAMVHRVAKSQTRLKQLSSSSSSKCEGKKVTDRLNM